MNLLLDPLTSEEFFTQYWEQKPLLIHRADQDYFSGIFPASGHDALLAEPWGVERLRVSKTVNGEEQRLPLPTDLKQAYQDGFTVVVTHVGRAFPAIEHFRHAVTALLKHRVYCNAFMTPPHAQGFPPHWDDHDVFVLQVEGSKLWRLHHPEVECPLRESGPLGPPKTPLYGDVRLEAGDMLYFPRGWIHQAMTGDEPSTHITVWVQVERWLNVIVESLVAAAAQDIEFRKAIPQEPEELEAHLTRLLYKIFPYGKSALDTCKSRGLS